MLIDANVFIYGAENTAKGLAAREAFLQARAKGAFVSPLVLDEVLWGLRKMPTAQEAIITTLRKESKIRTISVHSEAAFEAFDLMRKYNLKPRDALHVATMKKNGIKEILSDDPDFDKIPGIKRLPLS